MQYARSFALLAVMATLAGCSTSTVLEDTGASEGADSVRRQLPGFDDVWTSYPRGEAGEVKQTIGGAVNADWITNTCTIRVSRALNGAGFLIPAGPSLNRAGLHTVKGADGNNYAFRVAEMKAWLTQNVGAPTLTVKASGGTGVDPSQFAGRKGILMFDVRVWSDATGHFDVWNGKEPGHEVYFDVAASVSLWEMQGTSASDPAPDAPVQTETPAESVEPPAEPQPEPPT